MTLEQYLQQQHDRLATELAAKAPADCCPECNACEGHLIYESNNFVYECNLCRLHWPAECLEIDRDGNFQIVEWAD